MQSEQHELSLNLCNICKTFPGVNALTNVNLDLRRGEVLALVGENGAGKSTLMKILAGSYAKDSGQIIIEGKEVTLTSPRDAERRGISIIHQELNVLQNLTVAENIFLGRQPKIRGIVNWSKMNCEASKIFEEIGLEFDVKKRVAGMSIAQQQMIEVAKAICLNAKILIMDEPTSSLTEREVALLFSLIRRLKNSGVSIIFISHRLDEVFQIADRVNVLRDGFSVGTRVIENTNRNEIISLMIGRELTKQYPERDSCIGDVLISVRNIGDKTSIKNISFDVRRGEVLGFAGLVGAGRTELMRLIFGVDKKTSGEIYIDGVKIIIRSPKDSVRHGLAFVTEDRKNEGLLMRSALRRNVVMTALSRIKRFGLLNARLEREIAEHYVKLLQIVTPSINQKMMFLSGGNQQKVVVAKWLLTQSRVIILDEPTRGIDVGAKREIYQIINDLAAQGKAIILVSSEMEEIMGISDRVIVMCAGEISGELDKQYFSQKTISELAIGGARA